MKPQELFNARDQGEKIEVAKCHVEEQGWYEWDGKSWYAGAKYRIAPKPKRTVIKYQALCRDRGREFISIGLYKDDADAIESWGKEFLRLLTDRPIECEVQDE